MQNYKKIQLEVRAKMINATCIREYRDAGQFELDYVEWTDFFGVKFAGR